MTDKQIKHMVRQFLRWRLPKGFSPDAGISFKKTFNEHTAHPMEHEPVGTNLFDYTQAEAMVRYMLEGLPAASAPARQAKAEIDAEIAGAGEQTCYECGSELAVKVCLNCNREIAPAPLDVAIKALEDVYRFILAEYSDPEELALRGEPIAREAQNIWNTVCIAIAALRQHQDGGAG